MYDEFAYPFTNFHGCADWEWVRFLIPHFIINVIIYPCWDLFASAHRIVRRVATRISLILNAAGHRFRIVESLEIDKCLGWNVCQISKLCGDCNTQCHGFETSQRFWIICLTSWCMEPVHNWIPNTKHTGVTTGKSIIPGALLLTSWFALNPRMDK